jgi:hypothetical protein
MRQSRNVGSGQSNHQVVGLAASVTSAALSAMLLAPSGYSGANPFPSESRRNLPVMVFCVASAISAGKCTMRPSRCSPRAHVLKARAMWLVSGSDRCLVCPWICTEVTTVVEAAEVAESVEV